ncbi:MAG: CoB--CoM heterodisulfide reductase iron-sulfur subunit A family protein [Gemmatimonadota bacterium]|nr:MAG: CoB--CoM heterodisulfide reductase iron-sulfur subunit A family protein [Gemmatimonadota bacterium]
MEEIRIGVFVCNCGTNIAGFLDTKAVAEYSKKLPHVVFTRENLYSCSEAGVTDIKNAIIENKLNRVVVAACTPRTHEPLFRASCEEAGLNPFLFEFVNIREQDSWVHKNEWENATDKAKDLIRMGVARAAYLEPKKAIIADVEEKALVMGGGISGLSAALSLADRGFKVYLVEKEKELGGILRNIYRIYPSNIDAADLLAQKIGAVKEHPKIDVFTSSEVSEVKGYIGKYQITIEHKRGKPKQLNVGVIIVATGASVLVPEDMYNYDGKNVITQLELEQRLRDNSFDAQNVVMIKCVGARVPERVYCSRICCMTAIKNGIIIKEKNPNAKVFILYRDLMCYGDDNEELLRQAKEHGIRFVGYSLEHPPVVENGTVNVRSSLLGKELSLESDCVVLATPIIPQSGSGTVSKMLKVPLDETKFFLEAHIKLRPVDFATDGIYICGTAHWPAATNESVAQALGAAARASIPLTNKQVNVEPIVSMLFDEDLCRGCGMCAYLCPYGAIEMIETEKGTKAKMIEVACKGCGVCGATCYKRAIKMSHYTNEQIEAQIEAAFEER